MLPYCVLTVSPKFFIKGQLISKGHFGFSILPKNESRLGQKIEFSSSYFGRIEDTKKTTRNELTNTISEKIDDTVLFTYLLTVSIKCPGLY